MNIKHMLKSGVSIACFAGLLATVTAPAHAEEVEKLKWAVPISFSSNLTALGDTLPWVAKQLDRASGGNIVLEVFEPGKMIPALAVFESTATGQIEAGYSWMGYERGQVPASALFGAFKDRQRGDHLARLEHLKNDVAAGDAVELLGDPGQRIPQRRQVRREANRNGPFQLFHLFGMGG